MRQDIPDQANPSYMEFLDNTYQHIFGLNSSLIHSEMER